MPKRYPELIVAIAAAAWGLFWIPLRAFARQGLAPSWATLTQFLAPLLILLPLALWRGLKKRPFGLQQYRSGLLTGAAVGLYLQSLLLTDVARSLILFYAMPAWGTLIEIGLMGRSLTWWRGLSLLLSLSGLLIILSSATQLSLSLNVGDLMALLSGILFAFGAMQIRQTAAKITVFEQLFAFFFYGTTAVFLLSFLPLLELGQLPSPQQLATLAPWLILVSASFLIPAMWGIYWGSRQVDPGRLGLLLQLEAIVGILSAALFAGEPFGLRQAIGALLVIGAGITEVFGNRKQTMEAQTCLINSAN